MKKKPHFLAPTSRQTRIRLVLVSVLLVLTFGLTAARAFQLHLGHHHKLQRLAKRQYQKRIVLAPKRGNILDRQGETLALDLQVDSVYAAPHRISDPHALAKELAKLLQIPKDKLLTKLKQSEKKFVWIKRRISPEESQKLKEALKKNGLEAVGLLPEYKRFYPHASLASNLMGAVGIDAKALAGLELSYDNILKSQEPHLYVEQDAKGRAYNPHALAKVKAPHQLVLSLDKTIQYITEQALQKTVEESKAKGGVALVVHVKTGEILAMASAPTFDPNRYGEFPFENWRNRGVTDAFEPGSTFKAFTAALALEKQKIDTEKKLHCENGKMKVGKHIIHDHHGYGLLNLGEILKYSSNICSFKLAQKIGKEDFITGLRAFGFGQKTELRAPGEQSGFLASAKNIRKIQLGTIGFGQGISATPLQVAMAYAALANEGKLMKPLLVKEIRNAKGKTLQSFQPELIRQVVQPKHAKIVTNLLRKVVEKGGTGTQAALPDYTVAGKTGTAQKVDPGKRGYAKGKYVASFVGLAPVENPELVILISVDEPKGSYYGGTVSAPVFQKIMGQSLAYLDVPPSLEKQLEKRLAQTNIKPNTKPAAKPSSKPKKKPSVKNKASAIKPETKALAKQDSMAEENPSEKLIPNFTGLSVREVLREAQLKSVTVDILGSGICVSQEPEAGSPQEDTVVSVVCNPPSG